MIQNISYLLFHLGMAGYFIYAFFYPAETDFWLVKNGFPIIMLEFFGIFVMLGLAHFTGKDTGWRASGAYKHPKLKEVFEKISIKTGIPERRLDMLFTALIGLVMAFAFTAIFNIMLFVYFLVSVAVKYFSFLGREHLLHEGLEIGYMVLFLVFGMFFAMLFSFVFIFFPEHTALHQKTFFDVASQTGGSMSGAVVDNPGMITLWGMFYFVGMGLSKFIPIEWATQKWPERWRQKMLEKPGDKVESN